MLTEKKDIKSMYLDELKQDFTDNGQPSYKASQVYKWLSKGSSNFSEMSDISKEMRKFLDSKYYISVAIIENKLVSAYDSTVKYLFRFNDNAFVESVVMKYKHGYSICISTQVGCKMNCDFCATGKSGFLRNLTAAEMLSQIQAAQQDLGVRISNIVLMGMGEPLDNYDNVIRFLNLVSSNEGINIGMRHISLSTCGLVGKIYQLADLKLQLTLSISIHAPNDKLRNKIMPINKKYNLEELLQSCKYYINKTNRRISFEYAMISGFNDSEACARELASKLSGMLCHVNLIPVNPIRQSNYKKSNKSNLDSFIKILSKNKITATVRRTLGSDISASCGQLKRNYLEKEDMH